MKKLFILLTLSALPFSALAEDQAPMSHPGDAPAQEEALPELPHVPKQPFTWTQKIQDGQDYFFFDAPFTKEGNDKTTKSVMISVVQGEDKHRPDFIAILVPADVSKEAGLMLKFSAAGKDGKVVEDNSVELQTYEVCNAITCVVRLPLAFATELATKNSADIIKKFRENDQLTIIFWYPEGEIKTHVDLKQFQDLYNKLK